MALMRDQVVQQRQWVSTQAFAEGLAPVREPAPAPPPANWPWFWGGAVVVSWGGW